MSGDIGTYNVQNGDNLWSIANRTGVSINELQQVNGLDGDQIQAGTQLRIPARPTEVNDTSSPYTTAGGLGEGQGANQGLNTEKHLTGYVQSLTRDGLRGIENGSQVEKQMFLSEISSKYSGQSLDQATAALKASEQEALAGATDPTEAAAIRQAFSDARAKIAELNT